MKKTIITAILAISFQASVCAADTAGRDFSQYPISVSQSETDGDKLSSVPEYGAATLGFVGVIMLLRRRVAA